MATRQRIKFNLKESVYQVKESISSDVLFTSDRAEDGSTDQALALSNKGNASGQS